MTAGDLRRDPARFSGLPWVLVKLRTLCDCKVCGLRMGPGDRAYRPLTNTRRRRERIHSACMPTSAIVAALESPG